MNWSKERMGGNLLAVLKQIFTVCVARLRDRTTGRPQRMRIIERQALGPKQFLVLVEADGRSLLIASSHESSAVFFPLDALPLAKDREEREESIRRSHTGAIHLEPVSKISAPSRSRRRAL